MQNESPRQPASVDAPDDLSRALAGLARAVAGLARDQGPGARRHGQQVRRLLAWVEPRLAGGTEPVDGGRVLSLERVGPGLLRLRLARPADFRYAAGQYVKLGLGGLSRSYSLVSAPHEPALEFFVELRPGGAMSARLSALEPGGRLALGRPKGGLALAPEARRHLMVATVTGIAPFVSLLRERLRQGPPTAEFHVLHGASYQDELIYGDELEAMARRYPGRIHYIPAVSRPAEPRNAGWSGASGRVGELAEPYARARGLASADTVVYACGQPDMVAAVGDRFRDLGFQVRLESYG